MDLNKCPVFGKDKTREFMKDLGVDVPRAAVVQQAINWRKQRPAAVTST